MVGQGRHDLFLNVIPDLVLHLTKTVQSSSHEIKDTTKIDVLLLKP